jgi:hypothetical protein
MMMVIAKWSSHADLLSLNFMDHSSKTDRPTVQTESSNNTSIPICEPGIVLSRFQQQQQYLGLNLLTEYPIDLDFALESGSETRVNAARLDLYFHAAKCAQYRLVCTLQLAPQTQQRIFSSLCHEKLE